ncbi:hypothetical protein RRG08_008807 [Elysia crispata]|uniref:Uncharacterized protein n=1 Tax=Elysia crispata TaxID=231223 RepID=A0AAE1DBY8_9GAST|nr:hypothetical protein RRG08_008807 [Elysia crispata]
MHDVLSLTPKRSGSQAIGPSRTKSRPSVDFIPAFYEMPIERVCDFAFVFLQVKSVTSLTGTTGTRPNTSGTWHLRLPLLSSHANNWCVWSRPNQILINTSP